MWALFSVALVSVVAAIAALLHRYASKSVPLVVKGATAYAWLTSLSIIAIVPVDVWSTLVKEPSSALGVLWDIAYWSTQALTWLLLPFFQVYADAGDFTVGARCLTSLRENGLLYGLAASAGVVGLVAIIIYQKGLHIADLQALGMGLSNTFGLCAGILLMGYGLVEIPRHMWKSDPEQLLKWCAHRAGRFAEEVLKTTAELERVVTVVCANQRQMPRRDPLRPFMEVIAGYAEEESPVKPSRVLQRHLDIEQLAADDLEYNYDKAGLAALRRRLQRAIHEYKGAHTQYEEVIMQAQSLEAVMKSRQLQVYDPPPPTTPVPGGAAGAALRALWWRYRCVAHPRVCKAGAALLGVGSLAIIWSEATIFTGTHPDLSPFSLAIRGSVRSPLTCQLVTLLPLAYICACTYYALFKVNAFNYNKLLPRATTGASLMQNGSLLARFAAPTCWNFLHMVHMDGVVDGETTVFTQNLGTMAVMPVLGEHLNIYLPLLLVVHCALIWLNLWDRLTGACVGSAYRFTTDDVDDQYTEKGRLLIRREAEALANGLRVGELLHSSELDIDFPGVKRKSAAKRGWFSFGRKAAGGRADEELGGGPRRADSAAATSERAPLVAGGGARSDAAPAAHEGRASLLSSLVNNKHSSHASPPSSDSETSARASGLDGIFAELNTAAKPAGGRAPRT